MLRWISLYIFQLPYVGVYLSDKVPEVKLLGEKVIIMPSQSTSFPPSDLTLVLGPVFILNN